MKPTARLGACLFLSATLAASLAVTFDPTPSQADSPANYQQPPQAILDVLNAPTPPLVSMNPTRTMALLVQTERYPSIADLSTPMLRLAGLRIDPRTNGPHRPARVIDLKLLNLKTLEQTQITHPGTIRAAGEAAPRLGMPIWSPDGEKFAFTCTTKDNIELWIGQAGSGKATIKVLDHLNATMGSPLAWLADSDRLLCTVIPSGRGPAPVQPEAPPGPVIQESYGKNAPARTFQDLLQNPHDEALLDHYGTSQLMLYSFKDGKATPVGKPALFADFEPAPGGNCFLVTKIERPYSYQLPLSSFPKVVEVCDTNGECLHPVARLPLQDQIPIEGVPTGPRSVQWQPGRPATLIWVEAQDGGDPKKKVPVRDKVFTLDTQGPYAQNSHRPTGLLCQTQHRFAGLSWSEDGKTFFYRDFDRDTRRGRMFMKRLDALDKEPTLIFERSIQDRYGDPGTPVMKRNAAGDSVVIQKGNSIYLSGAGASRDGDRPFLDRFDLETKKAQRLFQSQGDCLESFVALLDEDGSRFITRHESPKSPPNYFEVTLDAAGKPSRRPITNFKDPAPQLRGIKKQLVRYKRHDGVNLSFTLYLPPGYQEGTRLPAVVWAYPREFNDPNLAGQVVGSPQRFTTLGGTSHLFFLLAGYAVLDDATMPVVGDPETANDTFVDQIVASAKAAIDEADKLGVIDPKRVGVGGHSYGAFMTANLLAHCDLFRAGIARSGAYNRTLTPFGFQSERRTLWEAPDIYAKLSPFMYAHKIKEPLLLIHGAADNNPGTFPVQSERLYQAVRGNGGNVRFVSLPHESHGYAARESIEHCLYEMITWFDTHVKNVK